MQILLAIFILGKIVQFGAWDIDHVAMNASEVWTKEETEQEESPVLTPVVRTHFTREAPTLPVQDEQLE